MRNYNKYFLILLLAVVVIIFFKTKCKREYASTIKHMDSSDLPGGDLGLYGGEDNTEYIQALSSAMLRADDYQKMTGMVFSESGVNQALDQHKYESQKISYE
jgi:hypothetical protein